jgi:hypothetical protein
MWDGIAAVGDNAAAQAGAVENFFNPPSAREWAPDGGLLGNAWDLPNQAIGALISALGVFTGGGSVQNVNGIIQTTGVSWMSGGLTVGNYTIYGPPGEFEPETAISNGLAYEHEFQHSIQSMILGPLFLPANLIGGTLGILSDPFGPDPWHAPGNFMETGPQSDPPRPF